MTTTTTSPGDGTLRQHTIHHDGVTIPVTRGGTGRLLVLCPGLSSTQADLSELAGLLRRDHDVVTFDLRGHGLASAASRYSFAAFGADLAAVLADLARREPGVAPVLVGYSMGADLAVHHAADSAADRAAHHPVAGLVLIDGANPLPEPFLTDDLLPQLRVMWEDQAARQEALRGTARQVLLTAPEIEALNAEIDAVRSAVLGRYRRIGCPISMIMSTAMAGHGDEEPLPCLNRNWRSGVERLVRERPRVAVSWLDADHGLVHTHAPEIARIIRGRLERC
ncbi:alpha/beta fold hydrolase [Nonomuraea wenchangensis]|uniref:alpha/beta fold hydrolase n=1 Tax=Nonomuraea wenchangensis TaxID=568860 RepID=UPI0037A206D8